MRLRAGLLLERDTGVFTFPHRSFQEFLAGTYIDSEDEENFVSKADKLANNLMVWREAILWAVSRCVNVRGNVNNPIMLAASLCPSTTPKDQNDWLRIWFAGEVLLETGIDRVEENDLGKNTILPLVRSRLAQLLEQNALTPRERAEAGNTLAKLSDPRIGVTHDFLFCEIPAGVFQMGDEGKQFKYDKIKSNYFMSRYPITNAQFDLFVKDGGYTQDEWWTKAGLKWLNENKSKDRRNFGSAYDLLNHPAVGVTWHEAYAFTRWATKNIERLTLSVWKNRKIEPLHLENGKFEIRLPSEAEWEYAAHGGKNSRYPWNSDEITPNHANYSDTNLNVTSTVGAFPLGMNDYGLLDMSGNVWEWCSTEWLGDYKDYLKKENNNPEGSVARVVRGGAYYDVGSSLRCAYRYGYPPFFRDDYLGFRVVVSSFPISLLRSGS